MSFSLPDLPDSPAERYAELAVIARALLSGESDRVANAANLSALVAATVPDLNWVGFYFFDGAELVVGPFQGLPACIRIPLHRGVCGTAARTRHTQRVDDVHSVADHIACDGATNSELVVPLVRDDELIGVFDLDSERPARFSEVDQHGLEEIANVYVESLSNSVSARDVGVSRPR
ncbi:GAF domain-containing protein [Tsukamurella serpentis]